MILISAIPIFSRGPNPNHIYTKKSIIESYGRNFREKCVSVSSAVDFEKLESLYEAYNDCATEVGDYEQFFIRATEDVLVNVWMVRSNSTLYLSDNQKTRMTAFLQTLVNISIIFYHTNTC